MTTFLWMWLCVTFTRLGRGQADEQAEYKGVLFNQSGLVWMSHELGKTRIQYSRLSDSSWQRPLQGKTKQVTQDYHFTHTAVDFHNRTFVAFDCIGKRIMAVSVDAYDFVYYWPLFEGTSSKVNGITVDWSTDVVYWTDAAYDVIMAVSMEMPTHAKVIVGNNLDQPHGIVAYPKEGYLFWTEAGVNKSRLSRSSLGGRHHLDLLHFVDRTLTTLGMDHTNERLYWIYRKHNGCFGIGSCDLDCENVKTEDILEYSAGTFYDLDIFKNQLFVVRRTTSAWNGHQILAFDTRDLSASPSCTHVTGNPFGIVVIDSDKQQYGRGYNPCVHSRCPGICTRSREKEDCFCTKVQKDHVTADVIRQYCVNEPFSGVLVAKADGIYKVQKNFAEFDKFRKFRRYPNIQPKVVVKNDNGVRAITSDVRRNRIYYYEKIPKIIKSVSTEPGQVSTAVSLAVGDVEGMAADVLSDTIYWTDRKFRHIMVARMDGAFPTVLFRRMVTPKAIAIHPIKRFLYWSDVGEQVIDRSFLDGSGRTQICNGSWQCEAIGLAIDVKRNRLYWCVTEVLFGSELDGTNREKLYSYPRAVFTGLSIMHDYVILSDKSFRESGLHAYDKEARMAVGTALFPWYLHGNWFGVHFHGDDPSRLKGSFRICRRRNGGCDQLCLPGNGRNVTCTCGLGYTLVNRTKCIVDHPTKSYILLADQRYKRLFHLTQTQKIVSIPVQALIQPYAVSYDLRDRKVYWSDVGAKTVSRAYLSGHDQEVILYERNMYVTSLAIDSGSRLLYYVCREAQWSAGAQPLGSLRVLHLETTRFLKLIPLETPHSMTLNMELGYIFFTTHGVVWRCDLDTACNDSKGVVNGVRAAALATRGEHVYFPDKLHNNRIYRAGWNGTNLTVVREFGPLTRTSALALDKHNLFWVNTTHRRIQGLVLEQPGDMFDIGENDQLIMPVSLFVTPLEPMPDSACAVANGDCSDLCLPSTPGRYSCHDTEPNNSTAGFCVVPTILYGTVVGNKPGLVVPDGYRTTVACFKAHRPTWRRKHLVCRGGHWDNIPECILDYDICGTPEKGYKAYTQNGTYDFFIYPHIKSLDVICVGGGGGGYDVKSDVMLEQGKAGDGEDSQFAERGYHINFLHAKGGIGGSAIEGGAGGPGGYAFGARGGSSWNCSLGGTAGVYNTGDDFSDQPFCGTGGFPEECVPTERECLGDDETCVPGVDRAGPGGTTSQGVDGGMFGGGAGSRGGGAGGGGGFSRLPIDVTHRDSDGLLVPVTVGGGGEPSYGRAGSGIVVISWGGLDVTELAERHGINMVHNCVRVT